MRKFLILIFVCVSYNLTWSQTYTMALAKYDQMGRLISEFDGDGKVLYDYSTSKSEIIKSSWYLSDGSLLVCGTLYLENETKMFVTKFNSKGILDNQFGTGGTVLVDFYGGKDEIANTMLVDSQGRIIIAGRSDSQFALARLTPNGVLDESFDEDGKVLTDFTSCKVEIINAVAIAGDKIYVGGYGLINDGANARGSQFALAKYHLNGKLDNSFDHDGKVLTDFYSSTDEHINDIKVIANKIVVGGQASIAKDGANTTYRQFALAKYNLDGSLDKSFDGDGKVLTEFYSCKGSGINSIEVLSNGSIIAAGWGNVDYKGQFALAMYDAKGALINSFDQDGKVLTNFSSTENERINVLAIYSGQIYVGGFGDRWFALAKYNMDGSLDNSFDGDGKVLTDFSSMFEEAIQTFNITENGDIVVAGYATPKYEIRVY